MGINHAVNEELLKNRVHIANAAKVSDSYIFVSWLGFLSYFDIGELSQNVKQFNLILFFNETIHKFSVLVGDERRKELNKCFLKLGFVLFAKFCVKFLDYFQVALDYWVEPVSLKRL